jgi:Ca2+-binding RTX toxin-like protein
MARFRIAPKPAPTPAPTSIDITGTNGDDDLKASNLGSIQTNRIFGLGGNDKLTGGINTADTLDGGAGNDLIRDTASGDVSNDLLIGGDGNDSIYSSGGADKLDGGDGSDYLQALAKCW